MMPIDQDKRSFFRAGGQAESPTRLPWLDSNCDFTDLCSRCHKCVVACPTGIINKGSGGFPQIDFSHGECTFCGECHRCCSEDLFDLEQGSPWKVKATISTSCLNNKSVYCRSCAESCESDAMVFEFASSIFVAPKVDTDVCTGCGACVANCPAKAISVKAPGKD